MKNFFLEIGLVIRYQGDVVEYVGRCAQELYFEVPETRRRVVLDESLFWLELQAGRISIIEAFSSPNQLLIQNLISLEVEAAPCLTALTASQQEEVIRRKTYVDRLMKLGITQGQVEKIREELPKISADISDAKCPSVSTVCRWWRRYLGSNGDVSSLISKNILKGSVDHKEKSTEELVHRVIEDYYLQSLRPSALATYDKYLFELKIKNDERRVAGIPLINPISARSFYNRINRIPKYEVAVARFGVEVARKRFLMIQGHMPADYPLDVVEIDHTPMNLYVIDDLSYLPLGRPWMTAIKDRYSGMLLGFYLSFQATGLASIFGALKHSLHSHQLACQRWDDLINPWPSFGRGSLYVSDRGLDFLSLRYRAAITSLGANYEYCQVRTPWLKGSIERFFLTLEQTFFESTPGRTFSKLEMRGGYDPVKHSVVRFTTLVYLLHKWAVDYHNVHENSRKKASPLELWTEGVGFAPPPYPASVDELNIILGHRETGKISHEGLRFKGLNYADPTLWRLMKDIGIGEVLEFAVSPDDLGFIHVKDPRSKQFFKVFSTRPEYASGLSLFQHSYLRAEATAYNAGRGGVDGLIQARQRVADVIANEVARKENKAKVRLARIAGLNSNKAIAGEPQSLETAFSVQGASRGDVENLSEASFTSARTLAWGV